MAEVDSGDGVDKLFRNGIARACYVRWAYVGRGHHASVVSGFKCDTSILTLARLDAWMFCACLMGLSDIAPPQPPVGPDGLSQKKGRRPSKKRNNRDESDDEFADITGPSRNTFHNSLFEIVFPSAVEVVLREVRRVVHKVRPEELFMPFNPEIPDGLSMEEIDNHGDSKTPCKGEEGHGGDLHSQAWRRVTSSHFSPYDNRHYVVALPSFISTHVCFWIGSVRDAFVGVCAPNSGTVYIPIEAGEASDAAAEP